MPGKTTRTNIIRDALRRDSNLGKVPARVLMSKYGCGQCVITEIIKELGIKPYAAPRPVIFHPRRAEIESDPDLATASVASLRKKHGCSDMLIRKIRREKGIGIKKVVRGYRPNDKAARLREAENMKRSRMISDWKCIPERVGLTKNEWLMR